MFELAREDRDSVIADMLKFVPGKERERVQRLTNEVVDLFEAQDTNALGVLYRAAEKKKFDEYVKKLKNYYEKEGKDVSVNIRSGPRNQNITVLRSILEKEEQIQNGKRDRKDRTYLPQPLQNLMKYPGAIKMEIFFFDCLRNLAKE